MFSNDIHKVKLIICTFLLVYFYPVFGKDSSKLNYSKHNKVIHTISNEYLYNVNKLLDKKIAKSRLKTKQKKRIKRKKTSSEKSLLSNNEIVQISRCFDQKKTKQIKSCINIVIHRLKSSARYHKNRKRLHYDLLGLGLDTLQLGINPYEKPKKPKDKRYRRSPITGKYIWY